MKTLKEKANKWSLDEKINTYAERDVKQFIKELRDFIEDKTIVKSSREGTNVLLVRFMPFEFEEFLKEKVGDLE